MNNLTITWRSSDKSTETAFLVPANGQELFFGTKDQDQIIVAHINYSELDNNTKEMSLEQKRFASILLDQTKVHDGAGNRPAFKTITFQEGWVRLQRYSHNIEWWRIAEVLSPMLSSLLDKEVVTIGLPERPGNYIPLTRLVDVKGYFFDKK
jgi:hypothetical protein